MKSASTLAVLYLVSGCHEEWLGAAPNYTTGMIAATKIVSQAESQSGSTTKQPLA